MRNYLKWLASIFFSLSTNAHKFSAARFKWTFSFEIQFYKKCGVKNFYFFNAIDFLKRRLKRMRLM